MVSYFGATLAITTILTAFWASQTEFPGHSHAPGTPDHVHQMKEVGLTGALAFVLALVLTALPVARAPKTSVPGWIRTSSRFRANCARAPPGTA